MYLESHLKPKLTSMLTAEKKCLKPDSQFVQIVPHCLNGVWIRLAMCISLSMSLSAYALGISYRDFSQWQQMSGWQGALRRGKSTFHSQNSVLHNARKGKCIRSIHIAKVLGSHSTIIILKVRVVWGEVLLAV